MLPESQLHYVLDPEDSLESRDALRDLGERDGIAVCECPVDLRHGHWMATQILEALDKDPERLGTARRSHESWKQVVAWCLGHRLSDLVVNRAQNLDARIWSWLFELASVARFDLWFVVQGKVLTRGQKDKLRDWRASENNLDQLLGRASGRTAAARHQSGKSEPTSRVPDADFLFFRAAARKTLEPKRFEEVDSLFRVVLARYVEPEEGEVCESQLLSDLDAARSVDEAVVTARAAQAGLLQQGVLLKVDLEALRVWKAEALDAKLDESAARELARYVDPIRAAMGVLALAAALSPTELAKLDLGDVDLSGGSLFVRGDEFSVPKLSLELLASALALRRIDGAQVDSPLLVSWEREERQRSRATPRAVQRKLRAMVQETGLPLLRTGQRHGNSHPVDSPSYRGLQLRRLAI